MHQNWNGRRKRSLNYLRVNKSHNRGPRRKSIFISLNALKARYFYDRAVYGKRQLEAKLKFDKLFSLNIRLAPRRCSLDSFFPMCRWKLFSLSRSLRALTRHVLCMRSSPKCLRRANERAGDRIRHKPPLFRLLINLCAWIKWFWAIKKVLIENMAEPGFASEPR